MRRKVDRPGVRQSYDRWSSSDDRTPNPLVALDRRHTLELPEVPLAQADLNDPLPVRQRSFDAALAAEMPQGAKYLDRPRRLTVEASKA